MIKSLTSLRGIFILFIFFHHCLELYPGGGSMAVAFFFILSGFSLTLGYRDKIVGGEFNYRQYLLRRCIKFYPLHWMCLVASVPLVITSLSFADMPVFLLNAALLQTFVPVKDIYFSFNAVSWYLADTLFFALLFPFLFTYINKLSAKGITLFAVIMVVLYTTVVALIPESMRHAFLYINPIIRSSDFVLGIILANIYLRMRERPSLLRLFSRYSWMFCIIVFALIIMLVVESCLLPKNIRLIAPVYWPFVGVLLIIVSLLDSSGCSMLENKFLLSLGECSFVFFLIHQLILRYSTILFSKFQFSDNRIFYVAFTLVLTIVASLIVDRYILKPITKWMTRRLQPSMTAL